jgi:transcriptional regulator with XRE-family HTH domain
MIEKKMSKKELDDVGIDVNIVAHNILALRTHRGLTANELSKILKLKSVKRIADFECGRGVPTLSEVAKISQYFGQYLSVSINDLLYRKAHIEITFRDEE